MSAAELILAAERMPEAVRQGLITKALGDRLALWFLLESTFAAEHGPGWACDEGLDAAREVIRATDGVAP